MPGEADPIRDLGAEPLSPTKECCNTTPTYRNNLRPEGKSGLERERERLLVRNVWYIEGIFSRQSCSIHEKGVGKCLHFQGFCEIHTFCLVYPSLAAHKRNKL